jgi:hypothetical protein
MGKLMIQFYFLSVFFNAVIGFMLISDGDEPPGSIEKSVHLSIRDETLRLIFGVLALVTGLLKLLSAIEGDLPILGDMIPSLLGLITGFILDFEYYRERSSLEPENTALIGQVLLKNKKIVGFTAIAVSALHFLFPKVLFL